MIKRVLVGGCDRPPGRESRAHLFVDDTVAVHVMVLGFMTASAVLSMWISNTATTLMLLPVGLAVDGADPRGPLFYNGPLASG